MLYRFPILIAEHHHLVCRGTAANQIDDANTLDRFAALLTTVAAHMSVPSLLVLRGLGERQHSPRPDGRIYLRMVLIIVMTATSARESRMRPCPLVDTENLCHPLGTLTATPLLFGSPQPIMRDGAWRRSC